MSDKRRLIVGLGKTGLSCARYFHWLGEDFAIVDSRENPPGLAEFRTEFPNHILVLGSFPEALFLAASELVISPGVSLQTPVIQAAIAAGVPVTGDIDIFSRTVSAPIVAVTGSNGKSTVVSLVGEMAREAGLKVAVGGNLDGAEASPALDIVRAGPSDLYVLELSSFQLETTCSLGAEVVVILNVTEDHMDRYATLREYLAAKQRIFLGCRQFVVNRDDGASEPTDSLAAIRHSYGVSKPDTGEWGVVRENGRDFLAFGADALLAVDELRIAGRHNVSNALAALALGHAVGLPLRAMIDALRRFPGLPHRCQWVRDLHDVQYYNDSKGTNVGASVVAIESLGELSPGRIVLIAGGIGKESDFSPMLPAVKQFVKLVILIGRDARKIAAVLERATETAFAQSMGDAVAIAATRAVPGDVVLLSPACASFDMFNDFTHRGRVFMEIVEGLR